MVLFIIKFYSDTVWFSCFRNELIMSCFMAKMFSFKLIMPWNIFECLKIPKGVFRSYKLEDRWLKNSSITINLTIIIACSKIVCSPFQSTSVHTHFFSGVCVAQWSIFSYLICKFLKGGGHGLLNCIVHVGLVAITILNYRVKFYSDTVWFSCFRNELIMSCFMAKMFSFKLIMPWNIFEC
jgi:hypothetical protein